MIWIVSFIILADYYLDIWVLTNRRVITIEQKGLFSRKMSEFDLEKIQEVSVDVSGFFPTLLDYGNIRVRTASENPDFIFKQVGFPNIIKNNITRECDACKKRARDFSRNAFQKKIRAMVSKTIKKQSSISLEK